MIDKTARVVVVGSLNMDLSIRVDTLPVPGETTVGHTLERSPGGKGGNQAVAASRLGATVELFGALGLDLFGDELLERLTAEGVNCSTVLRTQTATGVAMVVVDTSGENTITLARGANKDLTVAHLELLPYRLIGACALMLQLETPLPTVHAAARAARRASVPVVLNASPLPADKEELKDLLPLVDLLVVNETEASGLSGLDSADSAQLALALRTLGPDEVVVTLGARGAAAADRTGTHRSPAYAVNAVDAVGAGDAFCSALVLARFAGQPPGHLTAAIGRACAVGSLATTKHGAQAGAPHTAEVDDFLARVGSETLDAP